MNFEQVLQRFHKSVKDKEYIRSILDTKIFTVIFKAQSSKLMLTISKENVILDNLVTEEKRFDLYIQGNDEAMIMLLTGEQSLQKLIKNRTLSTQGSYSAVLKGETIFYLCPTPSSK